MKIRDNSYYDYTTNCELIQPKDTAFFDIADFNDNAEKIDAALYEKVDKVDGKDLSTNDYSTTEKNKLAGIAAGAQVNPEIINNLTTTATNKPLSAAQGKTLNDSKVPITRTVNGKALSENVTITANNVFEANPIVTQRPELQNGSFVHFTGQVNPESPGYVSIASIKVLNHYINDTMVFTIAQRRRSTIQVYLRFESVAPDLGNSLNPGVQFFQIEGGWNESFSESSQIYIKQTGKGEWDLIIFKTEPYDEITVLDFKFPSYISSKVSVTWKNDFVANEPSAITGFSCYKATRLVTQVADGGTGAGTLVDARLNLGIALVPKDSGYAIENGWPGRGRIGSGSVDCSASGSSSNTGATGNFCFAEGYANSAVGDFSHAEGTENIVTGNAAHVEGALNIVTGVSSHAGGYHCRAYGHASYAHGHYAIANVYASHAIGVYNNQLSGIYEAYSGTADAFVIGNGSSSATSNAFRVTFDGKTYGRSAFNSTGADYAEYFEWLNGNPENEDNVGYFVTLDGDKIRKAAAHDDSILGVVSINPSVIGDSHQDDWYNKYVRDEWGRIQYHYVDVPATLNPEGKEIQSARQDYVPVLNPDWNPEEEYIPREKRPEWAAVGMMGKLLVRDDGTCEINKCCKPNNDGIATAAETGFRVMKRVSENIVQILVK